MSPFQWTRKLFGNPSCRSSSKSNIGRFYLDSASSSSSTPTRPSPPCRQICHICQQRDIPFPEASPSNDHTPTPPTCIACINQLSETADTSEIHPPSSSPNNSQTPFNRSTPDGSQIRSCIACVRTLPDSQFPDGRIVESCRHEPEVCLDCIEKSIVEGLDNDLLQVIGCPQCGATMSAVDVWRLSGNQTFQRYETMILLTKEQECVICTETLPVSQFPGARVTDKCAHESNTCLTCISHHIQSQFESRMWDQLSCPECPVLLQYADVQKYATNATFQTYDSLAMKKAVSSDPNFRWCTAAGCSSGQVHPDGADSPLIICNSCRGLSCFTHQSPWHEGVTCLEFDNPEAAGQRKETNQEKRDRQLAMRLLNEQEEEETRRLRRVEQRGQQRVEAAERQEFERRAREEQRNMERERIEQERQARERQAREQQALEAQKTRARRQKEESASARMIQANTTVCPGGCGWRIQKNHGCDHMTCSGCKHQFCWRCLAPWEPIRQYGNHHHRQSCKYHSDNF